MKRQEAKPVGSSSFIVRKIGREIEIIIDAQIRISTKILTTLVTIIFGTALLTFAQISSFGQLILNNLRSFINF